MRLALAAFVLAAGFAAPAAAQYYGPGYGPPPPYEYGPPRRPPPPRYYDEDPYRRGPPPGYGRRGSSVCVTARGNCPIGGIVPRNSPCGCEVPGFGYKRGAAG